MAILFENQYMKKLIATAMARAIRAPCDPKKNDPAPTKIAPRSAISPTVLRLFAMGERYRAGGVVLGAEESAKSV